MREIYSDIKDLGPTAGIGFLFALAGVILLIGGKFDVSGLAETFKQLGVAAGVGCVFAAAGIGLLLYRIHELRLVDDEKRAAEKKKLPDIDLLNKLVAQFASHGALFQAIEYEDIGRAVNSITRLRKFATDILKNSDNVTFAAPLVTRAELCMQKFGNEIDKLEPQVSKQVDYCATKQEVDADDRVQIGIAKQLRKPVLSTDKQIQIDELARLSWLQAVLFVSALSELRGAIREILYQMKRAGADIPEQFDLQLKG